ncbi:MAG TPA: CHAT domain-containing protein [Anaerolineae bacterium]|nr:CHAT domain-containing protein [Anaerolineae bacterium]HQH38061.1 CHAT domain-containing protein [Anaerolineae bacterium]
MNHNSDPLPLLVEACRPRKLLLVWADTPFPPQETLRQPAALLINQWQHAAPQCAPLPWERAALPSLPVLSLDPTVRLEATIPNAVTVTTLSDVAVPERPTVLKLAGDLASRAGLFLTWDEVRAARSDRDKVHILREAAHVAAGGVVLVLVPNPDPTFDRFWTTLLAPALRDAAHTLVLGPPDYPWPAPLACIGPLDDATAIFSRLREVTPITPHRQTQPEGIPHDAADFADLEIHILPRRGEAYPVDLTLNHQNNWRGQVKADDLPWTPTDDTAEDGRRLFSALFADEALRTGWTKARALSPQRRTRLRLWLDVDEPRLHTLPWELLREGALMLAADAKTPFSRCLPVEKDWGKAVIERPLRALALIANPGDLTTGYNLASLNAAAERALLEAAFSALGPEQVALDFLDPPVTLARLEAKLQERRYHILHYVGHGAFNATREQAALFLQDERGYTHITTDNALVEMLARQYTPPLLVFLAACQSGVTSARETFSGLGPKLAQIGIPAVVAMQDNVAIKAANAFSAAFYPQLLRHGVVDRAMNEARSALLTGEYTDAAVPVLWMRLREGRLFSV